MPNYDPGLLITLNIGLTIIGFFGILFGLWFIIRQQAHDTRDLSSSMGEITSAPVIARCVENNFMSWSRRERGERVPSAGGVVPACPTLPLPRVAGGRPPVCDLTTEHSSWTTGGGSRRPDRSAAGPQRAASRRDGGETETTTPPHHVDVRLQDCMHHFEDKVPIHGCPVDILKLDRWTRCAI